MTENMKNFLERLYKDENLQKELERCAEQQRQERRKWAIELAGKAGLSLTDEDFDSMVADQPLADESLEEVAGGSVPIGLGFSAALAKGKAFRFF